MGPKKILVPAKWKDDYNKLQQEVLQIPVLKKKIEEIEAQRDELKSFETQLKNYKEEYMVMHKENKEAREKAKDLQSRNLELAKQVKTFRDDKQKVRTNTRRLEKGLKDEKRKNAKATAEIASMYRKLQTKKAEYEQEVRNRNQFAKQLKEEQKSLEREREKRLQDIHMKSLDRLRIDTLETAKEKLEKQLKMMSSVSSSHTHESQILTKALECSRNVSEMYEERLVIDDDEIADLKIRNAKLQKELESKEANIALLKKKNADVDAILRAVQAYAMTIARTSTEHENIMNPPKVRHLLHDQQYGPGGGGAEAWGDAETGAELIVRRDMEPPLSQAPTYSSLVKHFEGLRASRRLQRVPDKDDDGQEISFSLAGPGTIPVPQSSEPTGFLGSQYRFLEGNRQTEVSDTTLRQIQPPSRFTRSGLQLSQTSASGRPARATDLKGLPPNIDTFYSPGGTGDISLPSVASAPQLGGLTPDSFHRKQKKKLKSLSAKKAPRRNDGKSVADSDGSLYISTGIGIKRTKVKRNLKGSAKHMLDQILSRMAEGEAQSPKKQKAR